MITPNSVYDIVEDLVHSPNQGTWADLTTWDLWSNWSTDPVLPLIHGVDPIDLGEIRTFNLIIETQAQGEVTYYIYTSDTGAFAGEETETIIEPGDSDISGFSGRYVVVMLSVAQTVGEPTIYSTQIRASTESNTITLSDIDTSTLSGTTAGRVLSLPKTIGAATNMQITVKSVSNYTLDVYVTDYPTCNTVIPRIIDKVTPTIALVGLDNVARDAVIDVKIDYVAAGTRRGNDLILE